MTADPEKTLEEMIADLTRTQRASLEEQRAYNEALRSLLSRLTSLCHSGYFVFADKDPTTKWIAAHSILEILEGAKGILDGTREGHDIVDGLGMGLRRNMDSSPGNTGNDQGGV
jgi:hypothetical protein